MFSSSDFARSSNVVCYFVHKKQRDKHTHQYVLISFDKVLEGCDNLLSRLCFLKISVHCPVFLLKTR